MFPMLQGTCRYSCLKKGYHAKRMITLRDTMHFLHAAHVGLVCIHYELTSPS